LRFDKIKTTLRAVRFSNAETPGAFPYPRLGVVIPLFHKVVGTKKAGCDSCGSDPHLRFDAAKIGIIFETAMLFPVFLCNLDII